MIICRHGDSITTAQNAKHDRHLVPPGSFFPSRGIYYWRQMRVAQKPRWTGEGAVKKPSAGDAGAKRAMIIAALPARWPLANETPIRGWEKALIRQIIFEERTVACGVPAPRRHPQLLLPTGEGFMSYSCDAGCSSQRTNYGSLGPLRIFKV